MGGTKKLDKFELPPSTAGRTKKLEKYELPEAPEVPDEPESRPGQPSRALDREPEVERLRTRLARKFTTLADEVTECFQDFQIGAGAWGVELTAPEGMSTNAGKHATQHLRLRPRRKGHPVLVGGLVDLAGKTAELRDYDYVLLQHRARFGTELGITYDEWEQFLRKTEVVLGIANIAPARVPPTRELREQAKKRILGLHPRTFALAALGVIAAVVLLVAWRVLAAVL